MNVTLNGKEDQNARSGDWRKRIRESKLGTFLVLGGVAGVVILATSVIDKPAESSSNVTAIKLSGEAGEPLRIGSLAQDFTATTTDGKEISLSSLRGHPVWLTFGASWCAACQAEAPDIQDTYKKFEGQGVKVLGVFISENSATVKDYGARVGLTYLKVADPETKIASAYRVLGIPTNYFIDSNGILRSIKVGSLNPQKMEIALKELMK